MSSDSDTPAGQRYLRGLGNHFESESVPGSLPRGRNNPRLVPLGLYAEQLSGTAFTAPRCDNRRVWLYRKRPSAAGTSSQFAACGGEDGGAGSLPTYFGGADWAADMSLDPNPMRWGPAPLVASGNVSGGDGGGGGVNFLRGTRTMLGSGDPACKSGLGIYAYACDADMSADSTNMYNSDGDFLIVPQQLALAVRTELGRMEVEPGEICVVPRGVVFSIDLMGLDRSSAETSFARGYILEIFRGHFKLPELGPIGSNGLANARDFLHPVAECIDDGPCTVVNKFGQRLFARASPHTPFDVVAWQGNYLPYKYDLSNFCAVNSVTYDHPDPSIYTVLTARGDEDGTALADFVVFPPRVLATDENTLRPPWFHRNVMTEFMGLIRGEYDAKRSKCGEEGGFRPGGASLHSVMTPHGPDAESYRSAVSDPCDEPKRLDGGLAFMFETSAMCRVSRHALECRHREVGYARCWDGLDSTFTGGGGG